jgi:RHS repeat-associated protein
MSLAGKYDLGDSYFGARYYDSDLSVWLSVDRYSDKYPSLSPYNYCALNPMIMIDPTGDTLAVFKPDGSFWKFQDDGKETFSGLYYRSERTESYEKKDGTTGERTIYSDAMTFEFNDPETDVQAIKNGMESGGGTGITGISIMSDGLVEKMIEESGVKSVAWVSSLGYAYNESDGKMDYGVNGVLSGDLNQQTFYIREGVAYNVGDIGNYLWGRGMNELRISWPTSLKAAHINNAVWGRSQGTQAYNFGKGTFGGWSLFDTAADQNAIYRGHRSGPNTIMIY